jgi:hypothetical protein
MIIILEDDDNRIEKFVSLFPSAQIVKTAKECIEILDRQVGARDDAPTEQYARSNKGNKPCDLLMLDHDLSGEIYVDTNYPNTGSEVVRWIEENKPMIKEIIVHSYNHPAAMMMTETLISCGYDAKRIPFNYDWEINNENS